MWTRSEGNDQRPLQGYDARSANDTETQQLTGCAGCGRQPKVVRSWDEWGESILVIACFNGRCPKQPGTDVYGDEYLAIEAWNYGEYSFGG